MKRWKWRDGRLLMKLEVILTEATATLGKLNS